MRLAISAISVPVGATGGNALQRGSRVEAVQLEVSQPMYLERGKRESGRLLTRWNLVVPERMENRTWAEVT